MKAPPRDRAPAGNRGSYDSQATNLPLTIPESPLTKADVIACRQWVYRMVEKCTAPPPRFGSAEWRALDEGSAEWVASVCIAADAWLMDCLNAPANLALELDERRLLDKALEDAEYVARYRAHRRQYRHLRLMPDPLPPRSLEEIGRDYMAELVNRRRSLAGDLDVG